MSSFYKDNAELHMNGRMDAEGLIYLCPGDTERAFCGYLGGEEVNWDDEDIMCGECVAAILGFLGIDAEEAFKEIDSYE